MNMINDNPDTFHTLTVIPAGKACFRHPESAFDFRDTASTTVGLPLHLIIATNTTSLRRDPITQSF